MDWRSILSTLSPRQRAAIDLPLVFQRYRSAGGADDTEAFRHWLAAEYPPTDVTPPGAHPESTTDAAVDTPVVAPIDTAVDAVISTPPEARVETAADASLQTVTMTPVEVSLVLPARFAVGLVGDPNSTLVHDGPDARGLDGNRTLHAGGVRAPSAESDPNRTLIDDGRTRIHGDTEAPTIVSPRLAEPPASPAVAAAAPPAAPAEFHYVLIGMAGQGGMGTVHIAKDTELLRRVALKQLHAGASVVVSARTRFLREAQITAQLDHPNIVPVHSLEVAPDGMPAYTMKLVEGRNFHALLDEARSAFEQGRRPDESQALAARIEHFIKVCDAIAYAHDKGVIHRDLKPANLMLGRHNEVYVMDWGLCRAMHQPDEAPAETSAVVTSADISGSASDTQIGEIVGTPKYMSPEQARGRTHELDARSDQCALGLILFELATLSAPYEGRSAYDVLVNAAAGKRRPLVHAHLGKRGVSPDLAAIIERATALSPNARYTSVDELAADLRRYQRGDPVRARPDSLWQRTQRAIGRHRQQVLTGILALVALAAIAIGGLLWQNQRVFTAERLREQRLLQLRDAVADVSSDVQVRMVQLESAIENLSDSVSQISEYGRPVETRLYLQREFRDAATAPGDLVASNAHGGHISLLWPVWTLPKDMSESDAQATLRKLSALQAFHRDIYHRLAVMIRNKLIDVYAPAAENGGDDADGNPLSAIVLGLADGISSRYPGWDGLPDPYEPRREPWYTIAEGKRSPQWSDPYLSSLTHRAELSVSVPMYSRDQRFLGVVSALLDPNRMVQSLLDIKDVAGIRDVVLIDANGHILASLRHYVDRQTDGAPQIEVFPVPELLKRQKRHETGILETRLRGQPVILAFDEVEPLGWNIVAVVEPGPLLQATP